MTYETRSIGFDTVRQIKRLLGETACAHSSDIVMDLARRAQSIKAGRSVLNEFEDLAPVIVLLDGWLSLYKSLPDGQAQIIDFVIPLDVVYTSSAGAQNSIYSVEAVTNVTLVRLSRKEWDEILAVHPDLKKFQDDLVKATHARTAERMLRLGQGSAAMRIAYALIELCLRVAPSEEACHGKFHLPLTQQKLGEFTGLTSIHVCRVLGRLAKQGIIATSDHIDICILDPAALSDLAEVDVETLKDEIRVAPHEPELGRPTPATRHYCMD